MVDITFISHDGNEQTITAETGESLMLAATSNGVDGILADCGGACSCATCHVYIGEAWMNHVGAAGDTEQAMLEHVLEPKTNSRLSCQVTITEALNGMQVELPETQF